MHTMMGMGMGRPHYAYHEDFSANQHLHDGASSSLGSDREVDYGMCGQCTSVAEMCNRNGLIRHSSDCLVHVDADADIIARFVASQSHIAYHVADRTPVYGWCYRQTGLYLYDREER